MQPDTISVDSELVDIFQVAKVVLMDQNVIDENCSNVLKIDLQSTNFHQCERCRRFNCDNVNSVCLKCLECVDFLKKENSRQFERKIEY